METSEERQKKIDELLKEMYAEGYKEFAEFIAANNLKIKGANEDEN